VVAEDAPREGPRGKLIAKLRNELETPAADSRNELTTRAPGMTFYRRTPTPAGLSDPALAHCGLSPGDAASPEDGDYRLLLSRLDELLHALEPWALGLPIPGYELRPDIKWVDRNLVDVKLQAASFGFNPPNRPRRTCFGAPAPSGALSETEIACRRSLLSALYNELGRALDPWALGLPIPDDQFRPDMKVVSAYLRALATYAGLLGFKRSKATTAKMVRHRPIYASGPEHDEKMRALKNDLFRGWGLNHED